MIRTNIRLDPDHGFRFSDIFEVTKVIRAAAFPGVYEVEVSSTTSFVSKQTVEEEGGQEQGDQEEICLDYEIHLSLTDEDELIRTVRIADSGRILVFGHYEWEREMKWRTDPMLPTESLTRDWYYHVKILHGALEEWLSTISENVERTKDQAIRLWVDTPNPWPEPENLVVN